MTATTTSRTAAAEAQVLARMQCPCCHATSAVPPSDPTAYPIVDAYGDHALVCTHGNENREKYWHDPLRDQWASLSRMVGLTTPTVQLKENVGRVFDKAQQEAEARSPQISHSSAPACCAGCSFTLSWR